MGGFGNSGKCIYFREQRPKFEWNRETNTILGNSRHMKTALILGEQGLIKFISGEHGNS